MQPSFPVTRALAFFAAGLLAATAIAQNPIHDSVNRSLGLTRSEIVDVVMEGQPTSLQAALRLGGRWAFLDLETYSVRAPGFRLLEQDEAGEWQVVPPGPLVTMRGEVSGHPGSRVAAAVLDDGLNARILFADGRDYWLQPLPVRFGGSDNAYVLYRDQDVVRTGHSCGAGLIAGNQPAPVKPGGGGGGVITATQIAELGCDADFEYFQDYGSVNAVGNRIQSVVNTMNLQYESQVEIQHQITTILVRTSSNQPYTSTDAVTLLNQFRNEWNNNQGGITRDVAQLFTGKQVNGSTIGIAWIGAVCTSFGYGVVQSDFNNNFSCATDLSAHELGHNWNAGHCSCPSNTMNPSITCANSFSNGSINTIVSFRNSRTCLSSGGPSNQAPVVSAGPDLTVPAGGTANLDGTVSDDGLPNPPGQVTTAWSQVSGPGTTTFANASAVDTTATFSASGNYVLRLTADDSALSTSDDVVVTVQSGGGQEEQLAFDDFESGSGSGGSGWASVWTGSGDVVLTTRGGPLGSWHLRLRRSTGLAQRSVNLGGVSNAKLIFWARIRSFEGSDQALVQVSTNGGQNFTTVKTFSNGDDTNVYTRHEISLSSVSSNMVLRFDANMSSRGDQAYFDNVEFRGVR